MVDTPRQVPGSLENSPEAAGRTTCSFVKPSCSREGLETRPHAAGERDIRPWDGGAASPRGLLPPPSLLPGPRPAGSRPKAPLPPWPSGSRSPFGTRWQSLCVGALSLSDLIFPTSPNPGRFWARGLSGPSPRPGGRVVPNTCQGANLSAVTLVSVPLANTAPRPSPECVGKGTS